MSLVRKLLLHFHLYRERDGTFVLTSKVNHETSFRVHPLGFLGRTDGDGGLGLPNRPLHVRSRELMRRRKQRTDGHKLIAYRGRELFAQLRSGSPRPLVSKCCGCDFSR